MRSAATSLSRPTSWSATVAALPTAVAPRAKAWCGHSPKADQTVVVNYNDHITDNSYSGASYSTDGGATFTEIHPPPFATGHGTNYGDPIVVYNQKLGKWFAGDLVTGCGGQGIGLWTSPDGINWTAGACAHNGGGDDRESMWVDNDPSSAHVRSHVHFLERLQRRRRMLCRYLLRRRNYLECSGATQQW